MRIVAARRSCSLADLPFQARLTWVLIEAKGAPARMAHDPLTGPFGECDLADQARLDPVGAAGVLCRERRAERADIALQRPELAYQVGEHGLGEAGADVPGVPQSAAVLHANQQGADRVGPAAFAVI